MKKRTIVDIFLVLVFFVGCFFVFLYISNNCRGALGNLFWIEDQKEIDVDESIVVNFSNPLLIGDSKPNIEIFPKVDFDYVWTESGRKLVINPKDVWESDKNYFVKIKNLRNLFLAGNSVSMSFSTKAFPKVESFYPENDARDVVIDIEDPLRVVFDRPLDEFNVKFEVTPERKIGYKISEDKKTINFVFKDGYAKGQEYQIGLYVKNKKEENDKYRKIFESSFEVEAPIAEEWSKEYSERLKQAKKFTKAQIKEGKYIDINLEIQVMTIFEGGKALDSFLISSGKHGMDTPKGSFAVSNKHPRPWSKAYGLYMPYWMAIVPSGKFGIHELPEWPGGYKEGQNHLGTPVSHGCVRLGVGPAKRVYDWADIGTPIVIY